uniref:Uncharacterized protein n=1 Tax=Meloidogyne enterolobii TaxID=390850 RepID=A0A6V7XG47_MELEN|nr:unnamed protein product [Meloidogyne enterolobii]
MGLLLINILSLFLLLNFKFGDTIVCYKEFDLKTRNGEIVIDKLTTCDTEQVAEKNAENVPEEVKEQLAGIKLKCIKSDCGEYGYYKGCSLCVGVKLVNKLFGFKKDDCTCYECDGDKCNSASGVLSNLKIIVLFCLTIMIINEINPEYCSASL